MRNGWLRGVVMPLTCNSSGRCGNERVHREWVLVDERLHGELLVLICCDAPGIRFWQPLGRGRVGGRAVLA